MKVPSPISENQPGPPAAVTPRSWLMMPAGCLRAGERNDFTEVVIVLSGRGRVTIDGRAEEVGAGHSIYVPRGALWQLENTGREPLVCYSICTPARFAGAVH